MKRPLIIGYGNRLREDDGVGVRAAGLIGELLPGAEVVETLQLTPELVCKIAEASVVIFLDAAVDQLPGSVVSRELAPEPAAAWSHHLSPSQLLGLAEQLTGVVPPAFLVSAGVDHLGWSERLSPRAETTAAEMAASAVQILESC
jgi:hydrogenase maturation protease